MAVASFGLIAIVCVWCFLRLRSGKPKWGPRQRALVIVAHPDDESLFFANYIANAIRAGVEVHVMCLSTGNAEGLGHIRVEEMRQACAVFKVPQARLTVVDDFELQDGFQPWSVHAVGKHVVSAVQSLQPDELVTFDAGGVSGHPNHTSIYHAVRHLMEARDASADGFGNGGSCGKRCQVYALVTHTLLLKFSGPLGAMLLAAITTRSRPGDRVLLTRDPTLCFRAMTCHGSQFVWYRLLFVLFSMYTYANQLRIIGEL